MKAVTLTNNSDKKRRELDFYPTPPDVTVALMEFLKLPKLDVIWEPACGNMDMVDALRPYCNDVIATDIRNTDWRMHQADFLETFEPNISAIITNPPFDISDKFIIHAIKQAPIVAMLLKSQYWHAKKRKKLFEDTRPAYILALTWRPDFKFDTRPADEKPNPTMEVLWTVWIEGDTNTKYRLLSKP